MTFKLQNLNPTQKPKGHIPRAWERTCNGHRLLRKKRYSMTPTQSLAWHSREEVTLPQVAQEEVMPSPPHSTTQGPPPLSLAKSLPISGPHPPTHPTPSTLLTMGDSPGSSPRSIPHTAFSLQSWTFYGHSARVSTGFPLEADGEHGSSGEHPESWVHSFGEVGLELI